MNLKQLIKFGLENSSDPVIKNPVLRQALEPRSMDLAALSDDVVPGRLKDELEGKFNPDQETYEEYLQRINLERPFNMADGGRIGLTGGGAPIDPLDPQFKLADAIKAYQDYYSGPGKKKRKLPFKTFFRIYAKENFADGGSAGQLVTPSIDGSRPGYSGAKFNPNSIRKLEDGTWKYITYDGVHITGNKKSDVIKKMKVRRDKAQKKVEIQKKETAKKMAKAKTTYEGVGKHLDKVTTGPNRNVLYRYNPVRGSKKKYNKVKYFKKLTDAQKYVDEAVESTGRITDEKFLELRNKNKSMNNSEFANLLNKKKWKGIRGEKFTQYNVRNRQILLDVGPTGHKLKFDLTKKEVLDTVKDMKDGPQKIKAWKKAGSTEKGFENLKSTALKKKNYERIREEGYFETKDFKTRRKKALSKYEQSGKAKIARLKALETKGIFPMGDPELDLWRDLYLSSQTTGPDKRLTLKTKKPKAVLTKQGNKIIPWYTDDNYKKVKFLDNQTGKTITFNNLKKVLGEEKYNEVIRPYKEKYFIKDTEIDYKGKKVKLGTLINAGVFGSTRDINYFHVHHPKGKGKDPFFTQLTDYDANKNEWRPRGNLLKKINKAKNFGDKRKIVEDFIETSKGYDIYTQPGKKLYGTDIPLKEKIKIGTKEAGVRLSSTQLENLLKTVKNAKGEAGFIQRELLEGIAKGAGRALNLGLGPMGAAGLTYAWRPEGGYDLRRAGDRITFEAEAALAPTFVTGAQSVTEKIKNPLLRKGLEYASGIRLPGISPANMLRAARVASPIGLATLAGEGFYHAHQKEMAKRARMSPEELDEYMLEKQSRGWSKMAGGGIASIRRPNAIPPESGPTPQGLPSMYNRVKRI